MTRNQSRTLAFTLLLLALALAVATIAVPLIMLHRHYDEAIEIQLDLQARYARIGASVPALNQKMEVLGTINSRGFFLKNSAPALAASEVQEMIKATVGSVGGKIVTMRILEHKDDGLYRKITVGVQMNAGIGAAQQIFYSLEKRSPYLMLENVGIRAAPKMQRVTGTTADAEFFVQFDVAGYAIVGEQP